MWEDREVEKVYTPVSLTISNKNAMKTMELELSVFVHPISAAASARQHEAGIKIIRYGSIFSKDEKSYLTSKGVDFQLNDNNAGYVDRLRE